MTEGIIVNCANCGLFHKSIIVDGTGKINYCSFMKKVIHGFYPQRGYELECDGFEDPVIPGKEEKPVPPGTDEKVIIPITKTSTDKHSLMINLKLLDVKHLKQYAKEKGLVRYSKLNKSDLIDLILANIDLNQ
jgi:Rho termination factor, N-terminal domain